MKVQVSTTIASPPSEVAAFTSDARNEGQWHTDVLEISVTSGDGVEAGTTYHVRTRPAMGGVTEGTGTVLEHLRTARCSSGASGNSRP
jgi:hypothetical protein